MTALGIDFGTSNTVVARWDEARREGVPVAIPGYSREIEGDEAAGALIPSLIHYAPDGRRWIGAQVLAEKMYDSPGTFRWMKRYISRRSPTVMNVGGRKVSHLEAGRDFLKDVVSSAVAGATDQSIALAVPVEAYEHYEQWLADTVEAAGVSRFRLIDEASAAAFGHGAHLQPGDVFLVFDFGGGTLDVAIVQLDLDQEKKGAQRCRVVGKAGADLGGATIDSWIYEYVVHQLGKGESDEVIRQLSRPLLVECERAKELLSDHEAADIHVHAATTGAVLKGRLSRRDLEDLFDRHDGFTIIDQTVRRAMNSAQERGFGDQDIRMALLVGGSSLIPSVRKAVERIFGRQRVISGRPLDAVARGAAAFAGGIDLLDHIQHDYAIRHVVPGQAAYEYRVIVPMGTAYPTNEPLVRITVKASYDGQTELGLAIFELGDRSSSSATAPALELVFDPQGAARLRRLSPADLESRHSFWMNEASPTFLHADPPATRGEPRFEVEFGIDSNKRLLITARDLRDKGLVYRDHPVVRLV
jgi:molecular chaperone DnaK (HSP70)